MKFSFKSELWKSRGVGGWYFLTLPSRLSSEIREVHSVSEEGWGRLKTLAIIGNNKWNTSIWFDTKADAYLLPVKSLIRSKEKLEIGKAVKVTIEFEFDKWFMNSFTRKTY